MYVRKEISQQCPNLHSMLVIRKYRTALKSKVNAGLGTASDTQFGASVDISKLRLFYKIRSCKSLTVTSTPVPREETKKSIPKGWLRRSVRGSGCSVTTSHADCQRKLFIVYGRCIIQSKIDPVVSAYFLVHWNPRSTTPGFPVPFPPVLVIRCVSDTRKGTVMVDHTSLPFHESLKTHDHLILIVPGLSVPF